ncbi:MAG: hypothetical protein AB1775_14890 [Bacteroidota bacterium]
MAFINENPLFSINGKVGKYVVRKFNGKKIIALRPTHYKKTKSKQALVNQNKFAMVSSLAKVVNSNPLLHEIWKSSRLKGFSPYHRIIKANMKYAAEDGLSASNIIVPPTPYSLVADVSFSNDRLIFNINHLQFTNLSIQNNQLYLFVVLSFTKSAKSKKGKSALEYVSRNIILENNSINSSLQIMIEKNIINYIEQGGKCLLFSTLVWKSNNKVEWNSSFSKVI